MPEGPEVKRTGLFLAKNLSGKTIMSAKVMSGRYTKKPIEGHVDLLGALPCKFIGVGVHGKFIYMLTDKGINCFSTLGMAGNWSLRETKHTRFLFELSDKTKVYYNDQRNFGTLAFRYGPELLKSKLMKLGPDMLSNETSEQLFIERLRKKPGWNITKALMNQSVISGIGNYIKAESLWLAEISPVRLVQEVSDVELSLLYVAIKAVMTESYTNKSTHLAHKVFSDIQGDYSCRFLCYGRKTDAEGNEVSRMKTPDGRTTHWAPAKQK
jgi:formamidopyrimidine-DNA glycosylase